MNAADLRSNKSGLFAERKDTAEAYEYAISLCEGNSTREMTMGVAIMVYHNTLLEILAKIAESED